MFAHSEKNILGNDLDKIWETKVSKLKGGRIDFVLDNAGFELYCDCVYADWLIQSGIASEIHFHGKRFAWFVSDVTRKDCELGEARLRWRDQQADLSLRSRR